MVRSRNSTNNHRDEDRPGCKDAPNATVEDYIRIANEDLTAPLEWKIRKYHADLWRSETIRGEVLHSALRHDALIGESTALLKC